MRVMRKEDEKRGLAGSALKWIALFTMAIDHIGAAQIAPAIKYGSELYTLCRIIGRIAFPLFCFLLVEGFCYTRNRKRYLRRLFLFALLSEIPFDLAFYDSVASWNQQNVFFTLCLGLCALYGMEYLQQRKDLMCLSVFAAAAVAWLLRSDYDCFGVILIVVMYLLRDRKWQRNGVVGVMCVWEPSSLLALLPIQFYNGKRGWQPKYLFYWFYPIHLMLLWLLRKWIMG